MENADIIENEEELELRGIENVSKDKIFRSVEKNIGAYSQGMPTKILARAIDVGNDDVCMEIDIPMDEFFFEDKKFTFFRVSYNLKEWMLKNLDKYFELLFKKEVFEQEQKIALVFKNCIDSSGNPVDVNKIFTELYEEKVDVKDIKLQQDAIFLKINYKQIENNEIKLSFVDEDKKYSLEMGTARTKINNEEDFMKISNKLSFNELQPFIRKDKYEQLKTELISIEYKKKQEELLKQIEKYENELKYFSEASNAMKLDEQIKNLKEHSEKINFLAEDVDTCKGFLIDMIKGFNKENANDLDITSKAELIIERAKEVLENIKNNLNKNMNSELNKLKENVENLSNEKLKLEGELDELRILKKQIIEKEKKVEELEKKAIEDKKLKADVGKFNEEERLKNQVDNLRKLNDELKKLLKEKVEELEKKAIEDKNLKADVGKLKNEKQRLNDKVIELQGLNKELNKQLEEETKKVEELEKVIKDKKELNERQPSIAPKVNKNDKKELNKQQLFIDPKVNKNNDNSCCGLCCCCGSSAGEKDINLG